MAAVMKGFQETYIKLSGNQVCIGVGVTKVTGKPNHPAIYQAVATRQTHQKPI
jgi:hypothetical protein